MNIKALIARLEELPPEHEVLLSSDSEGNRYAKCDDLSVVAIGDDSNASSVELEEDEDGDEELAYGVVLWPV